MQQAYEQDGHSSAHRDLNGGLPDISAVGSGARGPGTRVREFDLTTGDEREFRAAMAAVGGLVEVE